MANPRCDERGATGVRFFLESGIGDRILADIDAATHSVLVMSPYVSPDLLDRLPVERARVTLVTSDACFDNPYVARALIDRIAISRPRARHLRRLLRVASAATATLAVAWTAFAPSVGASAPWLLMAGGVAGGIGIVLATCIRVTDYEYRWRFPVQRVVNTWHRRAPGDAPYFHAKAFVIDHRIAYVGSINLSRAGFFTHLESVVRITNPAIVHDIASAIARLATRTDPRDVQSDRLGRWLWDDRGHWRRGARRDRRVRASRHFS